MMRPTAQADAARIAQEIRDSLVPRCRRCGMKVRDGGRYCPESGCARRDRWERSHQRVCA